MSGSQSPKKMGPPKKEPGAPTGPRSAYLYFATSLRDEVTKKNPDWPHTEVSRELGRRWKAASSEVRAPFEVKEKEDRKRWDREMAVFKANKAAAGGIQADQNQSQNQNQAPTNSLIPTGTSFPATVTSNGSKRASKGAPKGPRHAFFYFSNSVREDIKKNHPDWSALDVSKELGNRWRLASDQDKEPFEAESKEDRKRHARELAEFNNSLTDSAKQAPAHVLLVTEDMEEDTESESEVGNDMSVVPIKKGKAGPRCCVCAKSTSQSSGTADKVLLCDKKLPDGTYCTNETHMYCLNPPLTKIPKGDFFCPLCQRQSTVKARTKAPVIELASGNGKGPPIHGLSKPDNTSLVPDQPYCRFIYESRFNLCMLFFLLLKRYKGDMGFELLYTPAWLEQHFKELLGGTLPRMPLYKNTLVMDDSDAITNPRMAIDNNHLYSVAINSSKSFIITKWDATTNTQLGVTSSLCNFSEVRSVCVHVGKIFIGFGNGNIRVCRTSDYTLLTTIEVFKGGHLNAVSCMLASDGLLFAGGGNEGIIAVFDTNSYTHKMNLTGHSGMVFSLTVNDGILYSGSFDKTIKKWNCTNFKLLHTLGGVKSSVKSSVMSLTTHEDKLIGGGSDGAIYIWRLKDDRHLATIDGITAANALCVRNDILYAISSRGHNIYVFDVKNFRYVGSIRHPEKVSCLSMHEGKLFSAHEGGDIKVLECEKESLSAPFGDPEVTFLPLKDLKARIIERKFAMGGVDTNIILPLGKDGGYNTSDINTFNSRGPGSELVRMYNHHVRATCYLSDRERRAPFYYNIVFPNGNIGRAKSNEAQVGLPVVPGTQLNSSRSSKKKRTSHTSPQTYGPSAPYLANLPPLPSLASLPSFANGQGHGSSSSFVSSAPTISVDQLIGWENEPHGQNGRTTDPLSELLGDLLAVGKKNAQEISVLRMENAKLKDQTAKLKDQQEKMQREIDYIKKEL